MSSPNMSVPNCEISFTKAGHAGNRVSVKSAQVQTKLKEYNIQQTHQFQLYILRV